MIKSSNSAASKRSSEKVYIAALNKTSKPEEHENKMGTLLVAATAAQNTALNKENNAASLQSGADPRSPVSNLEDPTPFGYRKEYLTFN